MKKITSLLVGMVVLCQLTYAGGGWATSVVNITKDGGTSYLYMLNNEGWTDGNWGSNTAFNEYSFGTPTSLILNGGAGNGWTDDTPGYNSSSFVLFYRVYKNGTTPGSWQQLALDVQQHKSGNNYIFEKTDAAVNILALANEAGTNTYTLEVTMSKNQFYTGGNWNSMVPGGQSTAYSNTVAGYKATFTKSSSTNLDVLSQKETITIRNNTIEANFPERTTIELYSTSGQLIAKLQNTNQFTQKINPGTYILRANGESFRLISK